MSMRPTVLILDPALPVPMLYLAVKLENPLTLWEPLPQLRLPVSNFTQFPHVSYDADTVVGCFSIICHKSQLLSPVRYLLSGQHVDSHRIFADTTVITPEIQATVRDPPVREFYKSLAVTYGVGAPVYLIMSLVGYW